MENKVNPEPTKDLWDLLNDIETALGAIKENGSHAAFMLHEFADKYSFPDDAQPNNYDAGTAGKKAPKFWTNSERNSINWCFGYERAWSYMDIAERFTGLVLERLAEAQAALSAAMVVERDTRAVERGTRDDALVAAFKAGLGAKEGGAGQ